MDTNQLKNYKALGSTIARLRKSCGYTQSSLANAIGVNRTHIARVELALVGVSLDLLYKISEMLNIPIYMFFLSESQSVISKK